MPSCFVSGLPPSIFCAHMLPYAFAGCSRACSSPSWPPSTLPNRFPTRSSSLPLFSPLHCRVHRRQGQRGLKYKVGDVLRHKRYQYRGVIVGWDPECQAGEEWIEQMRVDRLPGERLGLAAGWGRGWGRLEGLQHCLGISPAESVHHSSMKGQSKRHGLWPSRQPALHLHRT